MKRNRQKQPIKNISITERNNARLAKNKLQPFVEGNFLVYYSNLSVDIQLPIGVLLPYMGSVPPNNYWLICSGQTIETADYPLLSDFFYDQTPSYPYGHDTEHGTFNLPDLRLKVIAQCSGLNIYTYSGISYTNFSTNSFLLYTGGQDAHADALIPPNITDFQPTVFFNYIIYCGAQY
jgi:hypothetical protein